MLLLLNKLYRHFLISPGSLARTKASKSIKITVGPILHEEVKVTEATGSLRYQTALGFGISRCKGELRVI